MVETDWRQILSFSQRELTQNDKEKLCESLSWMEADDIELNFTDLKTLFRLSQDILKFKNEQVNNLLGEIQISKKKGKKKNKPPEDSPAKSSDSVFETIAQQEEIIKANKEILKQLYEDIAELEGHKNKYIEKEGNVDKESDSSKDALSELNAIEELENEVTKKNRHIRKLLKDIKVFEEENAEFKEKTTILKDKLTEATQIIENLTEQLLRQNVENNQLKEALGRLEESKTKLSTRIEELEKKLDEKAAEPNREYEDLQTKLQHWKTLAKSRKAENQSLSTEYATLRNNLQQVTQCSSLKEEQTQDLPIKELQNKLAEASIEIMQSAKIIETLRAENKLLKISLKEVQDVCISESRNESDDGKERVMINRLKIKVNSLNAALRSAEDMIEIREKELSKVTAELQLLQSGEEGLTELLQGIKTKKRQLKVKDEGIKSLVQEVNSLNETVDKLQLDNETLRRQLNIEPTTTISTKGTLRRYQEVEKEAMRLKKEVRKLENQLTTLQLDNHNYKNKISHLKNHLIRRGYSHKKVEEICEDYEEDMRSGGDNSQTNMATQNNEETLAVIEENEGLRRGLQEILEFLKNNSTSSSGVLTLQSQSLESVVQSMQARHAAGWFAPHMSAVLELRTVQGGRDALLNALHDARKETFEVMAQLSKESQKSQELEVVLHEIKSQLHSQSNPVDPKTDDVFNDEEFGNWISNNEYEIDYKEREQVEKLILLGNHKHENQLKKSLAFFHNKFKNLFDKMTAIAIEACDEQNKWFLHEEKYKAQIEQLKTQIEQNNDEDKSDDSPGLVLYSNPNTLQRKCDYIEECYKYIRTLNENIKNEQLENKKDHMLSVAAYEIKIQKLILSITILTDKLRDSIPIDMFWKQHDAYNDLICKFRQKINQEAKDQIDSSNLLNLLEKDKMNIINTLQRRNGIKPDKENEPKQAMSEIRHSILQKQVERLCAELEAKGDKIKEIEKKNYDLQEAQSKIIDETLKATTNKEVVVIKEQLEKTVTENSVLKSQCEHISRQLDIALLQLQDEQHKQMNNEMEVNMLRHQILDLQSAGDNKSIIARLSGEILVAHLQASETHKKLERLSSDLSKENHKRLEAEDMLKTREEVFNTYANRYELKFRYIYETLQVMREQYLGCIPLTSLENYLNSLEDFHRKNNAAEDKLNEIEDLRSSLVIKHGMFDQILSASKKTCLEEEDSSCPHSLKLAMMEGIAARETEYYKKKLDVLEETRQSAIKQCQKLEKSLVLLNQVCEKTPLEVLGLRKGSIEKESVLDLELEDIQSDDSISNRSHTITLPKPQLLKTPKESVDMTQILKENLPDNLPGSPIKEFLIKTNVQTIDVVVQTSACETPKKNKTTQTDADDVAKQTKDQLSILQKSYDKMTKELSEVMQLARQRAENVSAMKSEKDNLETIIENLSLNIKEKDRLNDHLQDEISHLSDQVKQIRETQTEENRKSRDKDTHESKSLLLAFKKLDEDKNSIVEEYKDVLKNEREEYAKSVRDFNLKVLELQSQINRKGSESSNSEAVKEIHEKYSIKVVEVEDECFKLRSDLDGCKSELTTYQSEVQRWKDLAAERLVKMEHLSSQLEQRHSHEVESYKAETQHWISQLSEQQRECVELRARITEQRAAHARALAEKDAHIDQLRSMVNNLKTQIMSMQQVMSANDPNFDLSAIIEVEDSEGSQDDRLEIRFHSGTDLRDDPPRMPSSSTAIWQEPLIERLRREKQLTAKQNGILRRQIKVLAARERRARLESQNIRNQMFRFSTSGSKVATADSTSQQAKIAHLQAQLSSARRDTQSSVALWDKWKRAQQTSETWQAKYEEKCREVTKLESSLNSVKSALARLEKEKRVLLTRLSETRYEQQHAESSRAFEKQELELSEKLVRGSPQASSTLPAHLNTQALVDRLEAQQRRIAALELADKGHEPLMTQYERSLAEITALKGQVLKLESELLQAQIQTPIRHVVQQPQELEYWKSYCKMLKEENEQLGNRLGALEAAGGGGGSRVCDLEQTVLTLRSLVSKLQAEQKSMTVLKRGENSSRPGSAKNGTFDKSRSQLESCRIEIANLKQSIVDKDNLLEKSKEMLKIAAEREDELLRENSFLRHQIEELTRTKGGFLSA